MALPRFLIAAAVMLMLQGEFGPVARAAPADRLAVQDVLPPFVLKDRMTSPPAGDPKSSRTDL